MREGGGKVNDFSEKDAARDGPSFDAILIIMTAAIGIQIGIGTEIDEKARNSTPIAIAISISTVHYGVSASPSAGNTVVS
jgi:hypothetical protein